ncbi:MAG: hypothetical protein IPP33_09505 [Flavobacteriales bacterium]|nr:hypothetical protein [Flavobacteriales bacterium]
MGDVYSDTVVLAFQLGVFGGNPEVAGYLTGVSGFACGNECNGTFGFIISGSGNGGYMHNGTPPFTWTFDVPVSYLGSATIDNGLYGGFEWAITPGSAVAPPIMQRSRMLWVVKDRSEPVYR